MTFGGGNNRGPSIAELQRFIREKATLQFTLNNGDKITGQLKWFDETAFQIIPSGQQPFTILRSAILGYQRLGDGPDGAVGKQKAAVGFIEKQPDASDEASAAKQTEGDSGS